MNKRPGDELIIGGERLISRANAPRFRDALLTSLPTTHARARARALRASLTLAFCNGIRERARADVITIEGKSASHELSPVPLLLRYASRRGPRALFSRVGPETADGPSREIGAGEDVSRALTENVSKK